MRGNRGGRPCPWQSQGSIPADAGQPWPQSPGQPPNRVYPRGCGATVLLVSVMQLPVGLSPRMRGNPTRDFAQLLISGSIPADAGQPHRRSSLRDRSRVYPRGCGATTAKAANLLLSRGLSPRMRGNLQQGKAMIERRGSIPADAGQPWPPGCRCLPAGVYPRGCGGNHTAFDGVFLQHGSIPADAGQPATPKPWYGSMRVYPRGCGATLPCFFVDVVHQGLSPRMRGNRHGSPIHRRQAGSIPADAGQPAARAAFFLSHMVYPRGCGATVHHKCTQHLG